jgi:hypothetical protein
VEAANRIGLRAANRIGPGRPVGSPPVVAAPSRKGLGGGQRIGARAANRIAAGGVDDLLELEVLKEAVQRHLTEAPPAQMTSSIADWEPKIIELAEEGLTAKPIYDRLRLEDPDFRASFCTVRAVWRRWRKARGVRAEDIAIPVETAPGDIAQIDFGYVGKLYDAAVGRLRKAWVFVFVLAYSRWMFARIVFDQKVETWLRLHVEAFNAVAPRATISAPRIRTPLLIGRLGCRRTRQARRAWPRGRGNDWPEWTLYWRLRNHLHDRPRGTNDDSWRSMSCIPVMNFPASSQWYAAYRTGS